MKTLSNISGLAGRQLLFITLLLLGCKSDSSISSQMIDFDVWLAEVKASVKAIGVEQLAEWQEEMKTFTLIDVRTREEYDAGYIFGAVNLPRGLLEFRVFKEDFWEEEGLYSPLKEDTLILYCRSGSRSALATKTLQEMGFTEVYSLEGGFLDWKEKNPEEIEVNISPEMEGQELVTDSGGEGGC